MQQEPTGVTSMPSVSTVGVLETHKPAGARNLSIACDKGHAGTRDLLIACANDSGNLSIACAINTPEEQNKHSADTSMRSVSSGGHHEHRRVKDPKDTICSWIECAFDQRSWAEVTGERGMALLCTPVGARVAGVGQRHRDGVTEQPDVALSCTPVLNRDCGAGNIEASVHFENPT